MVPGQKIRLGAQFHRPAAGARFRPAVPRLEAVPAPEVKLDMSTCK